VHERRFLGSVGWEGEVVRWPSSGAIDYQPFSALKARGGSQSGERRRLLHPFRGLKEEDKC
jgi:hypothetical protein